MIILALILTSGMLILQTAAASATILDQYIAEGIGNNLALRQHDLDLKKSLAELAEARGKFFPSVNLASRYSWNEGGRSAEIPVDDLLDTYSFSTSQTFRMLEDLLRTLERNSGTTSSTINPRLAFWTETEQQTYVSVSQPIFTPAIYYNLEIKKCLSDLREDEMAVFSRQLVKDIKTAYFRYLQALKVREIYQANKQLLAENLRVNKSLFRHNKVTEDAVFRAEAELAHLEQEQADAYRDAKLAQSYFNFLLRRPLDDTIHTDDPAQKENLSDDLAQLTSSALKNREEFRQLRHAVLAAKLQLRLAVSEYLPNLGTYFEYGFLGQEYEFDSDNEYWSVSLLMRWTLFDGFQTRAKSRQAAFEVARLETRLEELADQIELETKEAFENDRVAKEAVRAAAKREVSQEKLFNVISKKYGLGMVSQVEYIDAQTDLKNARLGHVIARYKSREKQAELERVCANFRLAATNMNQKDHLRENALD